MNLQNDTPQYNCSRMKMLLDKYAAEINSPDFIDKDPVQFPRRFSDIRDIEIVAFISAIIAWGNRTMIIRDIEKLLTEMNFQPYNYVADKQYLDFPENKNIHRTMFGRHLIYFLNGLNAIYRKHSSLDEFAASAHVGDCELPSYGFADSLQMAMCEANNGAYCPQCIPKNLQTSALKRFNMALRWLVRDDGIVDLGIWKSITKRKLLIPLDVHVGNTSRSLGLLSRKANDRKSTVILTDTLRKFNPEDPVIYDFALFGIGVASIDIKL